MEIEMESGRKKSAVSQYEERHSVLHMSKETETDPGTCYHVCVWLSWVLVVIFPPMWFCSYITIKEYERALLFRLGKLQGLRGPGLLMINPCTDTVHHVDLREMPIDVPKQQMMTSDTVTVNVNCVVFVKVIKPLQAILEVNNYLYAAQTFAATSLRSVVGACDLDTLLVKRDELNSQMKEIIEEETRKWGVLVTAVEIKDVVLPSNLQRAMASEAEQERERRAKIVNAQGEKESAAELSKAAAIISNTPGAMQLRYLHTLKNISVEKNSTIIFPLPMELFDGIRSVFAGRDNNNETKYDQENPILKRKPVPLTTLTGAGEKRAN